MNPVAEKLVRDRIAELAPGRCRAAAPGEVVPLLLAKVREEAEEVLASGGSLAEIADLLEVMDALCRHLGHTSAAVASARADKRATRGGFETLQVLEV